MNEDQPSSIPGGMVTAFQLEQLRKKYDSAEEFDPIKANEELQDQFSRFDAHNLQGERLAEQIHAKNGAGDTNTVDLKAYLAANQKVMDLSSAETILTIQMLGVQKGTPIYKAILKKRKQTMCAVGKATREAKRLSRKYRNSTNDFLQSFEIKRPHYNLFSRYTRNRLTVIKAILVAVAILLTLCLDQIVIAFDDRLHGRIYANLYHAGLFIFFALVDRFAIRPLEDYAFVKMGRNIFNKGLNFLSNQLDISNKRTREKINEFRSHIKASS